MYNHLVNCPFFVDEVTSDPVHPDDTLISEKFIPIYVAAGVIFVCVVTIVTLLLLQRRHQSFKNLEQRILQAAEEVDEDGEHYFVMRTSDNRYENKVGLFHNSYMSLKDDFGSFFFLLLFFIFTYIAGNLMLNSTS